MKKILTFILFSILIGSFNASAQTYKKLEFDKNKLPKGISYQGKIVMGTRWQDKSGQNIILLTESGAFPSMKKDVYSPGNKDIEIYGYQFLLSNGKPKMVWKIIDFVRNCDVDLYAGFLPNSLSITDLDNDGIAESLFLYKLYCKGGIDSSTLKLIMHEGKKKYAIRGTSQVKGFEDDPESGLKNFDPAFKTAPKAFSDYSLQKWNEFVLEKL